ncbi:MAG: NosD domain-containing protein [Dehalococcoidia bacterium]
MKAKQFYVIMAVVMALSLVAVALPAVPVGANGPETLWVGECPEGQYDYIQDAIDDADPGDTIMVCPGEYDEQLFINKQLTILSTNGTEETLIDGDGVTDLYWEHPMGTAYPTVWIDASGVVFGDEGQGFTVFGGWSPVPEPGDVFPGLLNLSSGCTIEGNVFGDSDIGILGYYPYPQSPSNNQIVGNEFIENDVGVLLAQNAGDTIAGNFFAANWVAIMLGAEGEGMVHDIDVVDNELVENVEGIMLMGSHGNTISGNDIWETGFFLLGAGKAPEAGLWLKGVPNGEPGGAAIDLLRSHDNTIAGNTINWENGNLKNGECSAVWGIRLSGSCHNDVLGNYIYDCCEDGILLDGGFEDLYFGPIGPSNDNLVQGNEVEYCERGIALEGDANDNRVLSNEVYDCFAGISIGTPLPFFCGNEIGRSGEGNTVEYCWVGISAVEAEDETITGNTVFDCEVGILLYDCHHMRVEDNRTWEDVDGYSPLGNFFGIILEGGSSENTVRGNDISYNWDAGLALGFEGGPANANFVSANRIHYNGDGIFIDGDGNDICGNDIRYNYGGGPCGVYLTDEADDNYIHCNNIVDNTEWCGDWICSWGLYNDSDEPVNAELNWWGDESGPGGDGPGNGDTVGGPVIFSPWLHEELPFPGAAPDILNTAAVPDMVSLLDIELLGFVMGDTPYSVGPSYTDLIVDTGCEPCETSWVVIDLSALVLGMLPEDIDDVVAAWPWELQNEWHEWLNWLAHTGMYYVEQFDEEAQEWRCFWDYDLWIGEPFISDRWEGWNLEYFFDWEDLMEMVFEEFRLGEFDIPVTAVDCSGNEAHGVITLAVVDFQLPMDEGWNVRSSPIAVGTSWGQMKSMGDGLMYEAVVMWDAEHGQWVEPSSGGVMAPLQAYYIAMSERDQIGLIISRQVTAPPQRHLYVGWNLIGVAPYVDSLERIGIYKALETINYVPGGLTGWLVAMSIGDYLGYMEEFWYNGTQLEKPWYEKWFEQDEWITFAADEQWKWMSSGGGYWLFMDNDDILGGYSYTPFPWWLVAP